MAAMTSGENRGNSNFLTETCPYNNINRGGVFVVLTRTSKTLTLAIRLKSIVA